MNWAPSWTTVERYIDIDDFDGEIWAHIDKWKGQIVQPYYFISNYGRLKSFGVYRQGKILPGTLDKTTGGYIITQIMKPGEKLLSFTYHQAVAEYFIDKPKGDENWCVDHKNTDKLDNRVTNLQWLTMEDNTRKAIYNDHVCDKFLEYQHGWNKVKCKFIEYPDLVFNSLSEAGLYIGHNTDYVAECLRINRRIKHKYTKEILHVELL